MKTALPVASNFYPLITPIDAKGGTPQVEQEHLFALIRVIPGLQELLFKRP